LAPANRLPYEPAEHLILIVGNYGSGKTEVSVNLALELSRRGPVTIVDLDLVNPYFRCREAREEMEARSIRVLYPQGEYHSADLPILLPEVKGAVSDDSRVTILDVGGDDVGARVLSTIAEVIETRPHRMLQVLNARRPFTGDVEGCLKIKGEIEEASRLRVTGVVSNTHLMDETDAATVREGIDLAREVADAAGITFDFATVDARLVAEVEDETDVPILAIERRMLPPWKLTKMADHADWIRKYG